MEEVWLKAIGASGGTVLALVVIGFLKGTIVPGWLYRREVENGETWERRFFQVIGVVNKQAEVLKDSVETTKQLAGNQPP